MLPSRCVRCGAASADFICASCTDYLIADRPLWLDATLLPGPSLLDLVAPRDLALVSADLTTVEWAKPPEGPVASRAVELIRLIRFGNGSQPILSVGDAELLHEFLRESRRDAPKDLECREALAALYRYLSSRAWLPAHLASEYGLRANVLHPRVEATKEETGAGISPSPTSTPEGTTEPSPPLPATSVPAPEEEPLLELPEIDLGPIEEEAHLPAVEPFPPEPIPAPEPPIPLPQPIPAPEPQPEPEPEEPPSETAREEFEEMRQALEKERANMEAWVRSRSNEIAAKETILAERELDLTAKARDLEAEARSTMERLAALEEDEARRDVLRFLGTIPGMSASQADIIAAAFPDIEALRSADASALLQCNGMTPALARAIRQELVPGEVDDEERASRLREEAHAFLEEGNHAAALDCYDRLLRDRPQDPGLWSDRAGVLALLGRPEEALQGYQRVIDADRRNRQAWFERANLLFGLGRFGPAIDSLREALQIDPGKGGDIALKAEQLRRDGHPNEAAILFQAILEGSPGDARAVLGLGDTLMDLGDTEAAEALFTQALGRNPQNAPILFRKGELLERKGRWGAAIQYYNRAIALRWNFAAPWLAKGWILLDHGRVAESLECFDKATALEPEDARAWAGKARAHAALGDSGGAREAVDRAVALNPDDPSVRGAREALEVRGPPTGVSTAQPPTDFRSLAKAFEEIEEDSEPEPPTKAASPDFQSFVESIEPDQEDLHVLLQFAELALEGGDPAMALLRYEQVIERDPRSVDAWTGKGIALQQVERYAEALGAYDRALALNPNHEPAKKWRATCLSRVGREESG